MTYFACICTPDFADVTEASGLDQGSPLFAAVTGAEVAVPGSESLPSSKSPSRLSAGPGRGVQVPIIGSVIMISNVVESSRAKIRSLRRARDWT